MSYRNWLNIVIVMIALMTIFITVLSNNINQPDKTDVITTSSNQVRLLSPANSIQAVIINRKLFELSELEKSSSKEALKSFIDSWQDTYPEQNKLQTTDKEASIEAEFLTAAIQVDWITSRGRQGFKIIQKTDSLFIQPVSTKVQYRFNQHESVKLLPDWVRKLDDKTGLRN